VCCCCFPFPPPFMCVCVCVRRMCEPITAGGPIKTGALLTGRSFFFLPPDFFPFLLLLPSPYSYICLLFIHSLFNSMYIDMYIFVLFSVGKFHERVRVFSFLIFNFFFWL
jgi:hypothetical protein